MVEKGKPSPWQYLAGGRTKCEELGETLFEACEQLAYAYQAATYRYSIDAQRHVSIALAKLAESGVDREDLLPITECLSNFGDRSSVSMPSHINDAQEELKRFAVRWIRVCKD